MRERNSHKFQTLLKRDRQNYRFSVPSGKLFFASRLGYLDSDISHALDDALEYPARPNRDSLSWRRIKIKIETWYAWLQWPRVDPINVKKKKKKNNNCSSHVMNLMKCLPGGRIGGTSRSAGGVDERNDGGTFIAHSTSRVSLTDSRRCSIIAIIDRITADSLRIPRKLAATHITL